jgi:hypothetical protein
MQEHRQAAPPFIVQPDLAPRDADLDELRALLPVLDREAGEIAAVPVPPDEARQRVCAAASRESPLASGSTPTGLPSKLNGAVPVICCPSRRENVYPGSSRTAVCARLAHETAVA